MSLIQAKILSLHSQRELEKSSSRVLQLTLLDSTSRNSFSRQAAEELSAALLLHASSFDALVFRADGRVFCSGGNLSDYRSMTTPDEGKSVNRRITEVLGHVAKLDVPTVCAVSGDCFGGGVELISAFDHIVSSDHALFGLWQRRIGLTFGWGGGARLEERLGTASLRRLSLSTEPICAREALKLRLIDELVLSHRLDAVAIERATRMAEWAKKPIASIKSWDCGQENAIFESLWWNAEHLAALKKKPGR